MKVEVELSGHALMVPIQLPSACCSISWDELRGKACPANVNATDRSESQGMLQAWGALTSDSIRTAEGIAASRLYDDRRAQLTLQGSSLFVDSQRRLA